MKSMTGFGRSNSHTSGKNAGVELEISVKAVNGRYLDIRFHLPREYAPLESEFKSILAETFSRGTLDVYVNRSRTGGAAPEIKVNKALAKSWLEGYRELAKVLKLKAAPDLELLSRVPEIFEVDNRFAVAELEKKLALKLLREAADGCTAERIREGQGLEKELGELCARLETIAEKAEALKTVAKAELEKRMLGRLHEHLQKLGYEGKVDEQRIAQEVVIGLDRTDISEELMRLRAHLKAYRQLLKSATPEGKKLDFYAQELLREINTIGSKSHIAELTSLVVDAKTLVEKIREQVQNAE
jgi:uncharacterized protein (TIGR00255 family)